LRCEHLLIARTLMPSYKSRGWSCWGTRGNARCDRAKGPLFDVEGVAEVAATLKALHCAIEPRRDAASVGRRGMEAGLLGRGNWVAPGPGAGAAWLLTVAPLGLGVWASWNGLGPAGAP
jgi:hypothetical protein